MMKLESIFSFFGFAAPRPPPPAAPAAVAPPPAAAPIADPVAAKREALHAKITEYADLPDGWDGFDGHAPAREDVDNALSFINHIPDAGIATAQPMVAGDGDVGFVWKTQKHSMELGFTDGEVDYFGDLPNGGERIMGADKYDKNAPPPEDLRRLMDAIFSS